MNRTVVQVEQLDPMFVCLSLSDYTHFSFVQCYLMLCFCQLCLATTICQTTLYMRCIYLALQF